MRGTIDQVEAFISGLSSAWARALTFLGCVSLGHLLGLFASDFIWADGRLHSGFAWMMIPSAPLTWLWAFVVSFQVPWQGILLAVVVATSFFLLVYTETPRFPVTCCVLVVQAWITFVVFRPLAEPRGPWIEMARALTGSEPPPITWLGTPFLLIVTAGVGALVFRWWTRRERE